MKKILILDDDIIRIKLIIAKIKQENVEINYANTMIEYINFLNNNKYNYLYLDHNLGLEEPVNLKFSTNTGLEIVNYVVENNIQI